jgi:hypothetical protein
MPRILTNELQNQLTNFQSLLQMISFSRLCNLKIFWKNILVTFKVKMVVLVVMYNTNGFKTETMYDYYIIMKYMFLVTKLFSPFYWLRKFHHSPTMN